MIFVKLKSVLVVLAALAAVATIGCLGLAGSLLGLLGSAVNAGSAFISAVGNLLDDILKFLAYCPHRFLA